MSQEKFTLDYSSLQRPTRRSKRLNKEVIINRYLNYFNYDLYKYLLTYIL